MSRLVRWLAIAAVVAFGLLTFAHNQADVDLWGNVGFTKALPGQDGFPRVNTFSFTEPDSPWVDHEWLGQYLLHRTHRAFGNTGLLGLKVLLGFALLALLAAFTALALGRAAGRPHPLSITVDPARFPSDALEYLTRNRIHGNALVFFDWAGQFLWHRYPGSRVFLDGRFTDACRGATVDDFFRFLYAEPGWERVLAQYPVDLVFIHRGNPAFDRMIERPGWTLIYRTELAAIFLRNDVHAATLARLRAGEGIVPRKREGPALFPN
jgi:hypothetical protein